MTRVLGIVLLLGTFGAVSWMLTLRALDRPFVLPSASPLRSEAGGLAILGTSLSTAQRWPKALQHNLETCLGTPLPLHIFARGGASSRVAAEFLDDLIAVKPRIVLIEYSLNDADLRRQMSVAQSRETHARILERLRLEQPEARLFLVRLNRAHGVRAALRPRLGAYEALYPVLAAQYGTGLLDTRTAWTAARRDTDLALLQPDGLHPTVAAADRVNARILTEQLAAQLTYSAYVKHPCGLDGR